jgi:hypothetical protein
MKRTETHQQFEAVIKADLNRWFEESDLDVEDLTESAIKALEDWLDEDTVEFEPEGG